LAAGKASHYIMLYLSAQISFFKRATFITRRVSLAVYLT